LTEDELFVSDFESLDLQRADIRRPFVLSIAQFFMSFNEDSSMLSKMTGVIIRSVLPDEFIQPFHRIPVTSPSAP
jgi:hypothetical protein